MEESYYIEEVTSFSPDIADALRQLVPQLDSHYHPLEDQDVQHIISSETTTLFLARDTESGSIVGMITLIAYRIPYKKKGILEDLVVDEKHRGKGIAKKLLQTAIEKAKQINVHTLMLTSQPSRESANKMYQHLGFIQHHTNVYRIQL